MAVETNLDVMRAVLRGLARGWRFRAVELEVQVAGLQAERRILLEQAHDFAASPAGQLVGCPMSEVGGITDRCLWGCRHKQCTASVAAALWLLRRQSLATDAAEATEAANDAQAAAEAVLVPYSAAEAVLHKLGELRSHVFSR